MDLALLTLFPQVEHLEGMPLTETNAKLYKAHYNYIKIWSDVSTPPGVIGKFGPTSVELFHCLHWVT